MEVYLTVSSQRPSRNEFEIYVPMSKIVSVKIDYDVLRVVDRLWKSLKYHNRSDFVRDAIIRYTLGILNSLKASDSESNSGIPVLGASEIEKMEKVLRGALRRYSTQNRYVAEKM